MYLFGPENRYSSTAVWPTMITTLLLYVRYTTAYMALGFLLAAVGKRTA